MANNKPIHILRYGTVAEKIHLEKAISSYDYLCINGNTAAFVSSAIAKFVVENFFARAEKGYFIDPITYAFQGRINLLNSKSKSNDECHIKKSILKLIEQYGCPTNNIKSGKPVHYSDFTFQPSKEEFAHKVLSFQNDLVFNHIKDQDLQKYLDYVTSDKSKGIAQFRPKFLIAPYFYLEDQDPSWKAWLHLNIELAKISIRLGKDEFHLPVFTQIVIDKTLLTNNYALDEIIKQYSCLSCDGFTVWVNDLNEYEASYEELSGFVRLLNGLKDKTIYNMYGGYFSILLTHESIGLLSGVSHGLEYGESRMVYPVGGGIPVSKYYFLPLHQRLDFTKAYYLLEDSGIINSQDKNWGSSEKYYNKVCNCKQCNKILGNTMFGFLEFESKEFYEIHRKDYVLRRKKASSDTRANCLYHYLLCKKAEISRTQKNDIKKILEDLISSMKEYQECKSVEKNEFKYIQVWKDVCEKAMEI